MDVDGSRRIKGWIGIARALATPGELTRHYDTAGSRTFFSLFFNTIDAALVALLPSSSEVSK